MDRSRPPDPERASDLLHCLRVKRPPEPCAPVRLLPGTQKPDQRDQTADLHKCQAWGPGRSPTESRPPRLFRTARETFRQRFSGRSESRPRPSSAFSPPPSTSISRFADALAPSMDIQLVRHVWLAPNVGALLRPWITSPESGVGEGVVADQKLLLRVRQRLLDDFDLHTILRLPGGIFYAGGVKATSVSPRSRRPAAKGPTSPSFGCTTSASARNSF